MQWSLPRSVMVASVAAIAFTGCLQESGVTSSTAATPAPSAPASVATTPARPALPDFSALVEQVGPAVVNISVTSVDNSRRASPFPFDEEDPFFEFFRRFGPPGGGDAPRVQRGVGSGFIVTPDGYILTNAHVVDGATEVTVKLADKRDFKAKVVGLDKRTDVALIKIEAGNLPVVKTGDPAKAKAGQWVLAMGSPFGLENTVTAGIISSKARRLEGESFVTYIQTDVAINPGNSGGPLLNLDGEVIGINSQIYSRSGGYMGISFAIPIDVALKVRDELRKHGRVQRGKLGVGFQPVDADLAQALGLDKPQGALVRQVEPDGPADKAGIEAGDVILQVDGTKIEDASDLPRTIGDHRAGDTVKLKIWRDKKTRDISVKLVDMPADQVAEATPEGKGGGASKLGLSVRTLNGGEAARLGVKGGLLVEQSTGAAAQAGIRAGDVILAVGNRRVDSVEELRRFTEAAGNRVMLLVQRGNAQQYVLVRL